MPSWTATSPDSVGGSFRLAVNDPEHAATSVAGIYDPEHEHAGLAPDGIVLDQVGPSTIMLVWRGAACSGAATLSIADGGASWLLSEEACVAAGPDVTRMAEIELASPRRVESIGIDRSGRTP
jgi:hypothetical protein